MKKGRVCSVCPIVEAAAKAAAAAHSLRTKSNIARPFFHLPLLGRVAFGVATTGEEASATTAFPLELDFGIRTVSSLICFDSIRVSLDREKEAVGIL